MLHVKILKVWKWDSIHDVASAISTSCSAVVAGAVAASTSGVSVVFLASAEGVSAAGEAGTAGIITGTIDSS